ncbi:MAG: hypothetical protein Kow0089_08910 [Desulfobulbaceae bacterium]
MNSRRTRGIVLTVTDHGESDRIVTLYTADLGRMTGIAKGAKRSRKRFVNKLEEFSLLEVQLGIPRGDTLPLIREADLEKAFLSLRTSYRRYVAATFAGELVLRFTRAHDPDPQLFSLLHWALENLDDGGDPLRTCALFLLRLLAAAGYRPSLYQCEKCGCETVSERNFFLHAAGGSLVCSACNGAVGRGGLAPVSIQTLRFLQHALQSELGTLHRLRLSRKNSGEALKILHRYTLHLLQKEIHSWEQLQTVFFQGSGNVTLPGPPCSSSPGPSSPPP